MDTSFIEHGCQGAPAAGTERIGQGAPEGVTNRVGHVVQRVGATILPVMIGAAGVFTVPHPAEKLEASLLQAAAAITWPLRALPNVPEKGARTDRLFTYLEEGFSLGRGYYAEENDSAELATLWHVFHVANAYYNASVSPNASPLYRERLHEVIRATGAYWGGSADGYAAGYDPKISIVSSKSERFVDDNLWMGLLFMDMYAATGDRTYVERATHIMDMALSQWDQRKGGVYWKVQYKTEQDQEQALVANMPAAALAARLAVTDPADGGNPAYAAPAEQIFGWAHAALSDPSTGLYFDNIEADGTIEKIVYSYGQGMAIEALIELHKINPSRYPLSRAIELAYASMAYFEAYEKSTIPKFDVIYLRSLMKLGGMLNDATFTRFVVATQERIDANLLASPTSLVDTAAAAGLQALYELPHAEWPLLRPSRTGLGGATAAQVSVGSPADVRPFLDVRSSRPQLPGRPHLSILFKNPA